MTDSEQRTFAAPYTIEQGAGIVSDIAGWYIANVDGPLNQTLKDSISSRIYSIVANAYTGREVSSASEMGIAPHKDVLLIGKIITDTMRSEGLPEDFIKAIDISGNCSELQGVSRLLAESGELYRPLEYIVYNYKVGFSFKDGEWMMAIEPVQRCNLCRFIEFLMAPTDEFEGKITYFFSLPKRNR